MTNEIPVFHNSEINYTAVITVLITAISTMFGYHVVNYVKYKKIKADGFKAIVDANIEFREELKKDLVIAKNELLDCKKIIEELDNKIIKLSNQLDKDKEIKDLIKQCEDRFINLANSIEIGIFRSDLQGKTIFTNKFLCDLIGVGAEELLGDKWKKIIHPSDFEEVMKKWEKSVRNHSNFEFEYRYKGKNDKITYVRTKAVREECKDGKLIGFIGVVIPLHDLKESIV